MRYEVEVVIWLYACENCTDWEQYEFPPGIDTKAKAEREMRECLSLGHRTALHKRIHYAEKKS